MTLDSVSFIGMDAWYWQSECGRFRIARYFLAGIEGFEVGMLRNQRWELVKTKLPSFEAALAEAQRVNATVLA